MVVKVEPEEDVCIGRLPGPAELEGEALLHPVTGEL